MDVLHYYGCVVVVLTGLCTFVSGDFCIYKSRVYYQGEKWEDGCQRTCMCVDASTRRYTCKDLCPEYTDIPHGCRLKEVEGQCCPELVCDRDVTPNCNTGGSVDPCSDKLQNCNALGISACQGAYQSWAREYCPHTCGFCMGALQTGTGTGTAGGNCRDRIPNCADYSKEACVNSEYRHWARDNCAAYCHLCSAQQLSATSPPPVASTGCVYKGQRYQEGATWTDECYTCTCTDATTGHYQCKDRRGAN